MNEQERQTALENEAREREQSDVAVRLRRLGADWDAPIDALEEAGYEQEAERLSSMRWVVTDTLCKVVGV